METLKLLLPLCFFLLSILQDSQGLKEAAKHATHHSGFYSFHPSKLFVFGDSYADTGNNRKRQASSWKVPYGTTFPGKPSGRFSDGRVLTDYVARFLGLKTPVTYRWRKYAINRLKYGMNFAYGGTGVFDTLILDPNMTTQIDYFQNLLNECVYTKSDLKSSLVLVALSGNDYGAFLAKGGTTQNLQLSGKSEKYGFLFGHIGVSPYSGVSLFGYPWDRGKENSEYELCSGIFYGFLIYLEECHIDLASSLESMKLVSKMIDYFLSGTVHRGLTSVYPHVWHKTRLFIRLFG